MTAGDVVYAPLPQAAGAALSEATFPDLLLRRLRERGDALALSQKRGGRWSSLTWRDYTTRVCRLALALQANGMQRGDRVAIMADACAEWVLADMAVMCGGGVTVGVYFTASVAETEHLLTDSGALIAFVGSQEQLDTIGRTEAAARLKMIVVMNPTWTRESSISRAVPFSTLEEIQIEHPEVFLEQSAQNTAPTDLAGLGYTSGTTGDPKAAMLTHRALICGAATLLAICPKLGGEDQRVVVHLPLSHTVARAEATTLPLIADVVAYFGETTALFEQALLDVRPTFYLAPPRFYQKFAAQIVAGLSTKPAPFRRSYEVAMDVAKQLLHSRRRRDALDAFLSDLSALCVEHVFKPLLAEVGFDKLRYAYTSSAPMPSEVMTLWQIWGVNLKEAYGQTEMVGGNVAQREDWPTPGTIGRPIGDPAWETRTLDDGEMIVRGPGLFIGYWNKPAETEKALKDGWLHTGDVVEPREDGSYRLIDRKKDIINTAAGKSISPTQIENELRQSPYVSEAVVIGDGRKYLAALIEVNGIAVLDWLKARDESLQTHADFAQSELVNRLIEGEIAKANGRLARVAQIKAFRILPEELTPEKGVMTATRKKKRAAITDRYRRLIDSLYDSAEETLIARQVS